MHPTLSAQDVVISEDDEALYAAEPGSAYPPGSFRPGRVIWAKVEGHDWWPARVVRRRAVPREVGPPPGGPLRVRTHIPVVFFTAKGIPGEVGDDTHKLGGTLAGQPACFMFISFLYFLALCSQAFCLHVACRAMHFICCPPGPSTDSSCCRAHRRKYRGSRVRVAADLLPEAL